MKKNSIKQQMVDDVAALSLEELADKFRTIRNQSKMLWFAEEAIKDRVRQEIGEGSELVLTKDYKAIKELRKTYGIEPEKAMSIVEDNDLFAQIVKVDLVKAKKVLPKSIWKDLESAVTVQKTTEALRFKGFEEEE